jgi:F-type H+-transporting ATPase subunit b
VTIDWFTLIAQIVNFLILVALLRNFLYGRIVQVADEREKQIASRYEEVEKESRQAQRELQDYQQMRDEVEQTRTEVIAEAREEAQQEQQQMLHEAREEIEATRRKWHDSLRRERALFLQELRQRAGQQVYEITRRALTDLANEDLEHQMVAAFISRIQDMSESEQHRLAEASETSGKAIQIMSAFDLSEDLRESLIEAVRRRFGEDVSVAFSKSEDLIAGIAMGTNGHNIAWNLGHYLDTLERQVLETLEHELGTGRERDSDEQSNG